MTARPVPLSPRTCGTWVLDYFFSDWSYLLPRQPRGPGFNKDEQKERFEGQNGISTLTTTERKERIPRPITKEPRWIKCVRIFPVSCWGTRESHHVSNQLMYVSTKKREGRREEVNTDGYNAAQEYWSRYMFPLGRAQWYFLLDYSSLWKMCLLGCTSGQ